jgi:hypothetical protein
MKISREYGQMIGLGEEGKYIMKLTRHVFLPATGIIGSLISSSCCKPPPAINYAFPALGELKVLTEIKLLI